MPEADLPLRKQPPPGQTSPEQLAPEQLAPEQPSPEKLSPEQPSNNSADSQSDLLAAPQDKPDLAPLLQVALTELQQHRDQLEAEIKDLSNRKSQLEKELSSSFAGQSDAIARRVKGFQDYLTGALQDLAQSVEQLELVVQPVVVQPSPLDLSLIHI